MSLYEILESSNEFHSVILFIIFIVLSFVKIPKKEVNLWGVVGKSVNGEVVKKITDVEEKVVNIENRLTAHIDTQDKENAERARKRILRFSDECVRGEIHSKELFEDILYDIDNYEKYCTLHPDYPNNKALMAIKNIKNEYQDKLKDNSFLTVEGNL